MDRRTFMQTLPAAGLVGADATASAKDTKRVPYLPATAVYELRVYHCNQGKLPDLLARFRDHTMSIFEKHGMTNVAYWIPTDDPLKSDTLFYIIAHASRAAADANWQAFRNDPEWKAVQAKSEANGKLVEKVDSTYLTLTDFSPRL
jgi:NIPSNAP protein